MSVYAGPNVVESGLVLALDIGNTKSYPGSGSTLTDLSNGLAGTTFNTPTYSATDARGSFYFDAATSEYVDFGSIFDNTFSAGITMQAWIKVASYSVLQRIFTVSTAAGTNYQYFLQTSTTSGFIQFGTSTTAYTSGLTAVGTGTWVNIAATCNYGASSIKIYLNGIDDTGTATGTPAYTADVGAFYISKYTGGVGGYGTFNFSNGFVYNRALSAQEVLQNFNALRGRFSL